MKKSIFTASLIALTAVFTFSMASCSSGGKSLNNAEALKEYLDKQPANSPDKPIKVSISANIPMLPKIAAVLRDAGKYVRLNLSGDALTTIPDKAFYDENTDRGCEVLVSVTIPNSVTSIGDWAFCDCTKLTGVIIPNSVTRIEQFAFHHCTSLTNVTIPDSVTSIGSAAFFGCESLTSVTFQGVIASSNFGGSYSPFPGDLQDKYFTKDGGPGTYKRFAGGETWKKQ